VYGREIAFSKVVERRHKMFLKRLAELPFLKRKISDFEKADFRRLSYGGKNS
jgi:hypothetical protein